MIKNSLLGKFNVCDKLSLSSITKPSSDLLKFVILIYFFKLKLKLSPGTWIARKCSFVSLVPGQTNPAIRTSERNNASRRLPDAFGSVQATCCRQVCYSFPGTACAGAGVHNTVRGVATLTISNRTGKLFYIKSFYYIYYLYTRTFSFSFIFHKSEII